MPAIIVLLKVDGMHTNSFRRIGAVVLGRCEKPTQLSADIYDLLDEWNSMNSY